MTDLGHQGTAAPTWARRLMAGGRLLAVGAVAYFSASGTGALAGAYLASAEGGLSADAAEAVATSRPRDRRDDRAAELPRRSPDLICDRNVFDHEKRPCVDAPAAEEEPGDGGSISSARFPACDNDARLAGTMASQKQSSSFALIETGGATKVAHPGEVVDGVGTIRRVGWRSVLVDPPTGGQCLLSLFGGFKITAPPPVDLHAKRGGITGEYYRGKSFEERVFDRTDKNLNFHWGGRSPDRRIPANDFSVRWSGFLNLDRSGEHQICAAVDNGARVTLGGRLIIDAWEEVRPRRICEVVRMDRGWHPLEVEYYEATGGARFRLLVGAPTGSARPVKGRDLCCRGESG